MRTIVSAIFISSCLSFGSGCQEQPQTTATLPPLADSLKAVYANARLAIHTDSLTRFLDLLDPLEGRHVSKLARANGFKSVRTFLLRRYGRMPNLESLHFEQIKNSPSYARMTFTGGMTDPGFKEARIRYNFVLFKRHDNQWKFSAFSAIEKNRYDRYGRELGFHETELPRKLRFPRIM